MVGGAGGAREAARPGHRTRVLVAGDVPEDRRRMRELLDREGDMEVVAEAADGLEALDALRRWEPELAILGAQMSGRTGLEVASEVGEETMPLTIFVAADGRHAVAAFERAALDYLVEPITDERFGQALRRARRRLGLEALGKATEPLVTLLEGRGSSEPAAAPAEDRIPVESRGETRFVPVDAIDYVTASGPYVELHADGRVHLVRRRMKALEATLDPRRFLRVHRSAIVRLDRVASVVRRAGGEATARLRDGEELPVSRRHRDELERRLAAG